MFKRRRKIPDDKQALQELISLQSDMKNKVRRRTTALQNAVDKAEDNLMELITASYGYVQTHGHAIDALEKILRPQKTVPVKNVPSRHFKVSAVTMQRTIHFLTGDPQGRERMRYATGIENPEDGSVTLIDTLNVRMSEQSPGYVKAHDGYSAALIDQLIEGGHQLWAMFHNHPTSGKNSTKPSGTDIAHQKRLVEFGMPHVLGGIASMDGYFRMFSTAQDFDLTLYGSGGEIIEDHPREKVMKFNMEDRHALLAQG